MKTRQKIRETLVLISFLLFPITLFYFSPALVIQGAAEGIITGSFIVFVLLFLSSLVFGRAFCGWVCPAGGIQEMIGKIQPKPVKKGNYIKWIIWIPWIAAILYVSIKNHGFHIVQPFYQTNHGISVTDVPSLIVYFFIVALIIVPAFVVGKRSFCHHICWMAPFMILGRKVRNALKMPALQLKSNAETCTHCQTCTINCPMSLPVEKMVNAKSMENPECILCGKCVDNCHSKSINYSFGRQKLTFKNIEKK